MNDIVYIRGITHNFVLECMGVYTAHAELKSSVTGTNAAGRGAMHMSIALRPVRTGYISDAES